MMDSLVVVGLWLSGISFALFVLSLLVNLFRRSAGGGGGGAGNVEQQGAAADLGKLFEAFSKLADSLNHSSPVVLSLMASIIFFALALLGAGLGGSKQKDDRKNDDDKAKVSMATHVCVFAPFDTGQHELSKPVIDQLSSNAEGCVKQVLKGVAEGATSIMFLVGHADHRNLRGRQSADYGTNETLAYQRALAIKRALLEKYSPTSKQSLSSTEFSQRMVIVEGGPTYLDRKTKDPQLATDRSVEVVSLGLNP